MVAFTSKAKIEKHLHILIFWALSGLMVACGSARLAPQHVQDSSTAIAIDSLIASDAAVLAIIEPYKEKLDVRLDSIIGYATHELKKQEVESTLGNFVADLTQEAARQVSSTPVDMGVVTIGGLRMPLPAGPIRMGNLYELMPFENMIVILTLSGEQTQELFEFAAKHNIVAISNSKMLVRDGKPVNIQIDGKPFDPSKSYTVATSDYLAGGGDNMSFFRDAQAVKETDILLRTAIVNKIVTLQQEGKKVEAGLEGRIEIVE